MTFTRNFWENSLKAIFPPYRWIQTFIFPWNCSHSIYFFSIFPVWMGMALLYTVACLCLYDILFLMKLCCAGMTGNEGEECSTFQSFKNIRNIHTMFSQTCWPLLCETVRHIQRNHECKHFNFCCLVPLVLHVTQISAWEPDSCVVYERVMNVVSPQTQAVVLRWGSPPSCGWRWTD